MGNIGGNVLGTLVVVLVVLFIVFLILRELFCWYWKINESVGLLHEIRDLLAKNQALSVPKGGQARAGMKRCPDCNEGNTADTRFCTNCGRDLSAPQTSPSPTITM